MAKSIQNTIQDALTTRLNLQIMVSSLPVVEEWMDTELAQWLESVPFAPEVPADSAICFRVAVGADFNHLRWAAYGHPAGFIPKMAEYLSQAGISQVDVGVLNEIGGTIEPQAVGSWIAVNPHQVTRGWHFYESRPFSQLIPLLKEEPAVSVVEDWLAKHSLANMERFSRSIGDDVVSEVEIAIPNNALDIALDAFDALLGEPIPQAVRQVLEELKPEAIATTIRLAGGSVAAVGIRFGRMHNDDIARICSCSGLQFNHKLAQVQGVLQAEGAYRAEYRLSRDGAAVEIEHIPGESDRTGPDLTKN